MDPTVLVVPGMLHSFKIYLRNLLLTSTFYTFLVNKSFVISIDLFRAYIQIQELQSVTFVQLIEIQSKSLKLLKYPRLLTYIFVSRLVLFCYYQSQEIWPFDFQERQPLAMHQKKAQVHVAPRTLGLSTQRDR